MGRPSPKFRPSTKSTMSKENLAVCQRIKLLRSGLGYSQDMLAEICRLNVSTIKHVEIGLQVPSLEILRAIAKHFNVDYSFLIDGKMPKKK
ncbi:MAG: helix-turn-helix transcriptional regulator [Segetibacter sp.]